MIGKSVQYEFIALTFLEADASEHIFHVDKRRVPDIRGGKLMLTGSTLLVGWPLLATADPGKSFDTLAFFEADCVASSSDCDSDAALRFTAVFFLGGISWRVKKDTCSWRDGSGASRRPIVDNAQSCGLWRLSVKNTMDPTKCYFLIEHTCGCAFATGA